VKRLHVLILPALLVGLLAPLPVGAVSASSNVIITADRVIEEDLFAAAGHRVIVEGTIRGDLTVVTQELIVTGVVEGDINGLAWSIDVTGEVGGSVRAVGWEVDVGGTVGDDVLSLARSLEVTGGVGRDVLVAAISSRHSGTAGGEIRGELLWSMYVDGAVAEDIDVGVHRLTITERASVGSAVTWRQGLISQNVRGWSARTEISDQAELGLVAEVKPIAADITFRAVRLLFHVLRFVGFLFLGMFLLAVFPRLTRRATDRAWARPGLTFLTGLGLFLFVPVAAVVSLFTIVLAPLGLAALGLWVVGLFVAAVPPLIVLGRRARSRSGPLGSFVVAAVVWRLLRLIPLAGFAIWLAVTVWGMGAWAMAMWGAWRDSDQSAADLESGSEPAPALALVEPGPRMELLGLEIPAAGPPASGPQPPVLGDEPTE
jgi:hypothetical protein